VIAAGAFVVLFVVLGLGTVLVAMRSGRGQGDGSTTRSARRTIGIGLPILIIVLAVGIPAIVLARNHNHHATVGPGGLKLTVAQVDGRHAFSQHCSTCHTLAGANAVGKVGPNLDLLIGGLGSSDAAGLKLKTAFVLDAIKNGRARGAGQMPAQLVVGREAMDVASFVAAVSGH
jgi:mono/diheme cytochrome c family protein